MTPGSPLHNQLADTRRAAQHWLIEWWRLVHLGALILVLVLSPSSYTRDNQSRMGAVLR